MFVSSFSLGAQLVEDIAELSFCKSCVAHCYVPVYKAENSNTMTGEARQYKYLIYILLINPDVLDDGEIQTSMRKKK